MNNILGEQLWDGPCRFSQQSRTISSLGESVSWRNLKNVVSSFIRFIKCLVCPYLLSRPLL